MNTNALSNRLARATIGTAAAWLLTACSSALIQGNTSSPHDQVAAATEPKHNAGTPGAVEAEAAGPTLSPIAPMATLSASPLSGNPEPDSYAYREDARQLAATLARTHGLDPDWVWSMLSQARVKENVVRLVMPAPTGTAKNWAAYRARFIEPIRIRAGVAFWRNFETELQRAEATYGVPVSIIVGVLGVESIYGRQTGGFRLLDALTTLSLDFPKGRSDRSDFFKSELGNFLKLCQEQGLEADKVLGSYAGAVGWPQFMPSSIRRFAVDFDGNGRIDLQGSPVDAIGSVANFLSIHGWERGWPAYYEIASFGDDESMKKLLAPDILPTFTAADMRALGVSLPEAAQTYPGRLAMVLLQNGEDAPTLVAGTGNFYAVTRYNQSSYYALAVIQLGQTIEREVRLAQARSSIERR